MQEYATEAIVLDIYPSGEYDARYSLFTKKYGKLVVRAKSVKKPLSKLAGHLQIGSHVRARIIEKKGLQVVDALKISRVLPWIPASAGMTIIKGAGMTGGLTPSDLYFLDRVLHEAESDLEMWELLMSQSWSWSHALRILGWDPARAECAGPHTKRALTPSVQDAHDARSGVGTGGHPSTSSGNNVSAFHIRTQEFFCTPCASKIKRNEVILL